MSNDGSAIDVRPLDGIRDLDRGNYIAGLGTAMILESSAPTSSRSNP
jgi:hypothetical protein